MSFVPHIYGTFHIAVPVVMLSKLTDSGPDNAADLYRAPTRYIIKFPILWCHNIDEILTLQKCMLCVKGLVIHDNRKCLLCCGERLHDKRQDDWNKEK